jgi:hypothetical protein
MSRVDNVNYLKVLQQERKSRVNRNSTRPVLVPNGSALPNFPVQLNKAKQPIKNGLSRVKPFTHKRNIGAQPQGAQRFPKAVKSLGGAAKVPESACNKGNSIRIGYIANGSRSSS